MYFPWFLPYFPIFPIYFPYILHIFPMFFTRFPRVVLAPVTARPLSRRGILRQRRQSFWPCAVPTAGAGGPRRSGCDLGYPLIVYVGGF
jgi:hypothetical protein